MSAQAQLAALRRRRFNFDLDDPARFAREGGWRRDEYRQPLPGEPPGEPVEGGSWAVACRLVRDYEFVDPALVRALFERNAKLEGRDMLLELQALGLRIRVGVRVGSVIDELRSDSSGGARVWGWEYRTLEGHIEQGQRFFEVWKHLGSGAVEFRTHAFSRSAYANPLLRLGFLLLGRNRQAEFGQRACERMARLTAAQLQPGEPSRPPERAADRMKLLVLYIQDHLAVLVGATELARRIHRESRSEQIRALLARAAAQFADDRAAAERLLREIGGRPAPAKELAAWTAEKIGRLKANGNPTGYSPLTRAVELEGLGLALAADRALWVAVERTGPEPARAEAGVRAALLAELAQECERLRLEAVDVAFVSNDRRL